jgi:hypothetical protein
MESCRRTSDKAAGEGSKLHIEQHHHAPKSWSEFARQYAMIVLSIMTALGLEHVAISLHDARAARDSRARIEAELARDLADLQHAEQNTTPASSRRPIR